MSTSAGSSSATKRKADELEEPANTKKQKVEEEKESDSEGEEDGSEEEDSEDDIDEDELADLVQDQEEAKDGYTGGRRTRGVKIDFSGKDNRANDDDDDDDDEEPAKEEEVVEGKGKGKAKPLSPGKPTSRAGASSTA
ncbi:hypothetical protein FRC17_008357 [Serendipita sp. 399]|nr:hypothetical protein FRC17_008357 [Serendipita sp. 399]